jgi:hypothetical protein
MLLRMPAEYTERTSGFFGGFECKIAVAFVDMRIVRVYAEQPICTRYALRTNSGTPSV